MEHLLLRSNCSMFSQYFHKPTTSSTTRDTCVEEIQGSSYDAYFCVTCCKQRWHLGITSPSSVCLPVRLSVCPVCHALPVTLLCNNSSFTYTIEWNFIYGHTFIRESVMYKICNSGINIFGVIPLCHFFLSGQ